MAWLTKDALEDHDSASKGKYTIGLGQDCMAFCTEVEDMQSSFVICCMTVVTSLLQKYGIDPKQIGRLEVGSETVIDKSKSIKTWLMQIFEFSPDVIVLSSFFSHGDKQKCGNTDIEGVDSTNACYGGTAALFNCVNWVESSSWDGRFGLVVCADSAVLVYAEGPARPTGGAAAVAMLIGPHAPIVFESKYRGTHMAHVYDFYKPNLASEYPVCLYLVVDGKLSQTCYLMALDSCYKRFSSRSLTTWKVLILRNVFLVNFQLVQKSFARLYFNDFMRNPRIAEIIGGKPTIVNEGIITIFVENDAREKLQPFISLSGDESYQNRDLEKASQQAAKLLYDAKVQPSTLLPKEVGNMYTASLYAAFASVLHDKHGTLFPPEKFVETMKLMEHRYGGKDFVTDTKGTSLLAPGTFYLTKVDSMYRRFYAKKDEDNLSTIGYENGSLLNGH
ncbi:hypothetical protein ACLOJK_006112 [Asimina triloba]